MSGLSNQLPRRRARAGDRVRRAALLAAAALTSAAATSAAPTAARAGEVEVVTNPPGAACIVRQRGATTQTIKSTPATIKILTFADGLRVTCTKAGLGSTVFEIGEPDAAYRGQNDLDDGFFDRIRQRRRNVALRRLKKIELDFVKTQVDAARR